MYWRRNYSKKFQNELHQTYNYKSSVHRIERNTNKPKSRKTRGQKKQKNEKAVIAIQVSGGSRSRCGKFINGLLFGASRRFIVACVWIRLHLWKMKSHLRLILINYKLKKAFSARCCFHSLVGWHVVVAASRLLVRSQLRVFFCLSPNRARSMYMWACLLLSRINQLADVFFSLPP